MAKPLTERQVEQLALLMQFLYELGFDLATVKHAADCWWQVKDGVQPSAEDQPKGGA